MSEQRSWDRPGVRVGAEDIQRWKEAVTGIRIYQAMAEQFGDPANDSDLAVDDASCPATAHLSDAARAVLFAALENLAMWCDAIAPKVYVEGAVNEGAARPHFTLARAGIECASQAVWLLEPEDSATRIKRHLRLVLADMDEQSKALVKHDPTGAAVVTEQTARLREQVGQVSKAPNYLDMVRAAAHHTPLSNDRAEALWRTASAAAHGKAWFVEATHTTHVGHEFAAGWFRAYQEPRPEAVSAVVTFAADLVRSATALCAKRLGLDVDNLFSSALSKVRAELPRSVPDTGLSASGG